METPPGTLQTGWGSVWEGSSDWGWCEGDQSERCCGSNLRESEERGTGRTEEVTLKKDGLKTKGMVLISLAASTGGRSSSLSNTCEHDEIREEI